MHRHGLVSLQMRRPSRTGGAGRSIGDAGTGKPVVLRTFFFLLFSSDPPPPRRPRERNILVTPFLVIAFYSPGIGFWFGRRVPALTFHATSHDANARINRFAARNTSCEPRSRALRARVRPSSVSKRARFGHFSCCCSLVARARLRWPIFL